MPEPAATKPVVACRPSRSGVNEPAGGATSTSSPASSRSTSHSENRPLVDLAHPDPRRARRRARRSSTTAAPPRRRRSGAGSGTGRAGTRRLVAQVVGHVEGDGDGVVAEPLDVARPAAGGSRPSAAPSCARRVPGRPAAAQRRARGGAEAGDLLGGGRAAAWAAHRRRRRRRASAGSARRGAARPGGAMPVLGELAAAGVGDPVGASTPARAPCGPRRRAYPAAASAAPQVVAHLVDGGAARVGRGDRDGDRVAVARRRRGGRPGRRASASASRDRATARPGGSARRGAHHVAPGCCRARLCISASTCPSCSVCTPCRPPRPPIVPMPGPVGTGQRGRGSTSSSTASTSLFVAAGSTATPAATSRSSTSECGTARRRRATRVVQRGLHAPVRLVGAVAEAQRPAGGVVAVVGDLLDALGRDGGEHRVARVEQPLQQREPPRREQQQPGDRVGEVAVVGQLGQRRRCGTAPPSAEGEIASRPAESSESAVARAAPRCAARASSSRAWPSRSSAVLASATSSSSSGAFVTHSESRWP